MHLDPAFDDRVMAEIARPVVLDFRPRRATFFRRPAVRVVGGLAAAAAITTIAVLRYQPRPDTTTPTRVVAETPTALLPAGPTNVRTVNDLPPEVRRESEPHTFTLEAPEAKVVTLVGDFTGWEKNALKLEKKDGVWSTTIMLTPGLHKYLFQVDGKWVNDPNQDKEESNEYGQRNSIVIIEGRIVR